MQPTAFFILAGAACSLASPAVIARQDTSEKASPVQFELFSQYAQAAYCQDLFNTVAGSVVCTDHKGPVCANFQGTVTVKEFSNDAFDTIAGYVAVNPTKKHIVVAFKGTDPMSLVDVKSDLAKNLVSAADLFPACGRCTTHNGFKKAFSSVKDALEQTLKTELAKTGQESYRVVVTGHSLGGAVATIAGAYLRTRGIACDLYTYGSPRVGNQEFADMVTKDVNFSARITNGNDIVTAVPYGSLFQLGFYAHTFPEYWYKAGLLGTSQGYQGVVTKCNTREECAGPTCGKASIPNVVALSTCNVSHHVNYIDPAVLPCKDVRKPKSDDPRDAPITDEEFRKFLEEQENEEGDQKRE
ncbi:lipase precursor [Cordyceps militaris]|uniref:Lipase n=1 Tax=Cordyceps militaris TaxID=73501 RepID=A0A2H4SWB1_CORMI|nr:lipase precursor [Cordyceps militaris]